MCENTSMPTQIPDTLSNQISLSTQTRVTQMKNIHKEALNLFTKKNTDYGDAFATHGSIGVLVRMGDKLSRLQSVTSKQVTLIDTESVRDTLIDLHNYAAMAIMLLDEDKNENKDLSKLTNASDSNELQCSQLAWRFINYKNNNKNTNKSLDNLQRTSKMPQYFITRSKSSNDIMDKASLPQQLREQ